LSREGAADVLRRLSMGEARFKELNETVTNTRTLTRRLRELCAEGEIQKNEGRYRITGEGFEAALRIAELEEKVKRRGVNCEEFVKMRNGWIRASLRRLTELFVHEFGNELVSLVLYGSVVKDTFQLGGSDIDLLYVLEDCARNAWQREGRVFRCFRSTWEYRTCDYWLRVRGFCGYPEVTTASLRKSDAESFQSTYLDMLRHRAVLFDREEFFQKLMIRLKEALGALGTFRIEYSDGTYCWILKPHVTFGEQIRIDLG